MLPETVVRPPHPEWEPREGYEWRVVVDLGWQVATPEESAARKCRHSTRQPCPNEPVAAFNRGRLVWWVQRPVGEP